MNDSPPPDPTPAAPPPAAVRGAHPDQGFVVVGLGASAGGLAAIRAFFRVLPPKTGAAYVLAQHLSPDHRSMMQELLGTQTALPVVVAKDGLTIEPDHVYVMPPGSNVEVRSDLTLGLLPPPRRGHGHINLPINLLFESMAQHLGSACIAVVLSGTGSDGAMGLAAVADQGGIALAQDPATAEFDGMPISAIQTGVVDVVASPPDLARRVGLLLASRGAGPEAPTAPAKQRSYLDRVLDILQKRFDLDLHDYKAATLLRRVERRASVVGATDLGAYVARVEDLPEEQALLLQDLLIGVTSFFRDEEVWQTLSDQVIDAWAARATTEELRVWVTACSTGEEAYSVAMLLIERFEAAELPLPMVRIFATDVSKTAIEVGAAGVYSRVALAGLSPARLARFFDESDGSYRVKPSLRRHVVFAQHDLTRQAPFSRMDLVTCRNMLIYMRPRLQRHVLAVLHYSLKPGGTLLLGTAEGLLDFESDFKVLHKSQRLYRKRGDRKGHLPVSRFAPKTARSHDPGAQLQAPAPVESVVQLSVEALLDASGSVAFVVGRDNHLLHIFGVPPAYLRLARGAVTTDLAQMLPRRLALSVTTGLHRARSQRTEVVYRSVEFSNQDRVDRVHLQVFPLGVSMVAGLCLVVIQPLAADGSTPLELDVDEVSTQRMEALEAELRQTRENLQAAVEELQTTNEEQQATNEELLASNEELQSTNEELQSVNEELHTVNAEFQLKLAQQQQANADFQGLLGALGSGVVFLDDELRILHFNPAATHLFRLVPLDVGRPLVHLADSMDSGADRRALHQLIRSQEAGSVTLHADDKVFRVEVVHLQATEVKARTVLNIVDVTHLQATVEKVEVEAEIIRALAKGLPDVLWVIDDQGTYTYISESYEAMWGRPLAWILENPGGYVELLHPEDREWVPAAVLAGLQGDGFDITYRIVRDDGTLRWLHGRGIPERDRAGHTVRTVGIISDITHSERVVKSLARVRVERAAVLHAVSAFAYVLDTRTRRIDWFGAVQELLGYDAASMGTSLDALVQRIHPDDRTAVRAARGRATESRGTTELTYRLRAADGQYQTVLEQLVAERNGADADTVVGVLRILGDQEAQGLHAAAVERTLDALTDSIGAARWTWDRETGWSGPTPTPALLELTPREGRTTPGVLTPAGIADLRRHMQEVLDGTRPTLACRLPCTDPDREVLFIGGVDITPQGRRRVSGVAVFMGEDHRITAPDTIAHALLEGARSLPLGLWLSDPQDRVRWANGAAEGSLGPVLSAEQEPTLRAQARDSHEAVSAMARVIPGLEDRYIDSYRVGTHDGHVVGVDLDVTSYFDTARALRQRTTTDALTGLWNRDRFREQLELQARRMRRRDTPGFAVLFMDLNGFKQVNDSYDHSVGDQLLAAFARRLPTCVRPGDHVARFGGDEFAVLVENITDYRDALKVAENIHAASDTPLSVGPYLFDVRASIGIAMWDPARGAPDELLRDADVAMYEAKRSEDNRSVVFDAEMHARVLHRHEMTQDLHQALNRDELRLYLQSFRDDEGRIIGHEALMRWHHPTRGVLAPGAFLHLARASSLLDSMERWVFDEALRIVRDHPGWFTAQRRPVFSLNITALSLKAAWFSEWLTTATGAEHAGVRWMIEITEDTLLSADPITQAHLERIRDCGVLLAIDDFGTGYSSLSYLLRWTPDVLKLDATFAHRHTDTKGIELVRSIVELGEKLSLTSVLEGVEDDDHIDFAAAVGVDWMQGYAHDRPAQVATQLRRAMGAAPES